MDGRDLSWLHWTLGIVIGLFALPVLVIPAGFVILFMLPVALLALPVVAWSFARA